MLRKQELNLAGELPQTTVKQLRDALGQLGAGHDNALVQVWLPGSAIALAQTIFLRDGKVMIEGNVTPGSALDRYIDD
jgi:hypothetical protein